MKKNLLRHIVLALLITVIGLTVTVKSAFTFMPPPGGPMGVTGILGPPPLPPAAALVDHDDLKDCAVKSFSIDASATNPEMNLNVDCSDGSAKKVAVSGKTIDQFKIAYIQAFAAYLENSKIQFGGVQQFVGTENYTSTTITIGPK